MAGYYKLYISDSLRIINCTQIPVSGINILKNYSEKRSKGDPFHYYVYVDSYDYRSKNLIGAVKTVATIYKAGSESPIKINGWTFPSRYVKISEVHMKWADDNLHFKCTSPSGKSVDVGISWGEPYIMDKIIKAISYLIKLDKDVPPSILFYKDKILIG